MTESVTNQPAEAVEEPRFLRRKHAAQILGMSATQLDNLRRAGYLPRPVRMGPSSGAFAWDRDVLRRYLDASAQAGHLLETSAWEESPVRDNQ